MRSSREHQIVEHVGIEEQALHKGDQEAFKRARVGHFHPDHQMHTLILGLVQQLLDPSIVVLHSTEGTKFCFL